MRTYTTAFTQYKDQTIEYRPLKLAPGETDVVVKSLIKQPSGQPVAVDYRMEKTDTGWKVYDVKIEGISLVENYRNTFNTEVQRNGIDGLIKSLADKNRAQLAKIETARDDLVLGRPLHGAGAGDHGERRSLLEEGDRQIAGAEVTIDLAGSHRGRFDRGQPAAGVAPPGGRCAAAPSATSICPPI